MQQKNEKIYPEVITMEEYLAKRRKIKENEQNKKKRIIFERTADLDVYAAVFVRKMHKFAKKDKKKQSY